MGALNCRSDRRQTGTQIGQIGKTENRIGNQNRNPLVFFAKIENQKLKNEKSANHNEHQNRKTEVFWHKNRKTEVFWHKNRKTNLKNSQNRKTENSNAHRLKKQACVQHTFLKDCQKYMNSKKKGSKCITNSIRFGDVMIYG